MGKKIVVEMYLIGSELKNQKIIEILKKAQMKEDTSHVVISTNSTADSSLTKNQITHKQGNYYLSDTQENIENETRNWVSEWVLTKSSIYNSLKYKNDSFWWFIDRRIRFEFLEIFFLIRILQAIEKKFTPNKIIWYDESNNLDSLIPQIFSLCSKDLKKIKSRFHIRAKNWSMKLIKGWFGIYFLNLRERWFGFRGKFSSKAHSLKNQKIESCIAIVTNSASWRSYYNTETNQYELGDYYFEKFITELRKKFSGPIFEVFKINNTRKDLKVIGEKYELTNNRDLVILDTCMDKEVKYQLKKEIEFFKRQYKTLKGVIMLDDSFVYSDINFAGIMRERVLWYFRAYIPLGLKWKAHFTSFIKQTTPSVILFINEFFTFGKALILSCRENDNVSSFALQHGFFTELDIGPDMPIHDLDKKSTFVTPLTPDKTFIYGSYYERLLFKVGYKKENVLISGNPSYDFSHALMMNVKSKDIFKDLNLQPNKKTLVFGTQPDFFETAIEPIRTIIDFGNQYSDIQIIIKVHPREDIFRYEIFKEGTKIPVRIIKEIDIFSLLKICDLYLSQHSTTILDAVSVGKPVVIVNFTNRQSPLRFLNTDGILELTSSEQLTKAIPRILEDPEYLTKHKKLLQTFLIDQAFKIDGKASERIVKAVIKELKP